ncbi:MAG: hypothetical protein HQK52_18410 [Oligoflexia bacterium]|nr:hypothetical protein [Oligoflexia bacterium]
MLEKILQLPLRLKIILMSSGVSLLSLLFLLIVAYSSSKSALETELLAKLSSNQEIAKQRIEQYLKSTETFTYRLGFNRLLEGLYLAYDTAFTGSGKFTAGVDEISYKDSTLYKKVEQKYGERLRQQVTDYSLGNILVANPNGQVVLSANPDPQAGLIGRNLKKGVLKDTLLAKNCFLPASESKEIKVFFSDFELNPITHTPMTYLCTRQIAEFAYDDQAISPGDPLGVVIIEISIKYLSSITSNREGMGDTGQAYLVGSDQKLRSDFFIHANRFNVANSISQNLRIDTPSVALALKGNKGDHIITSIYGAKVISSYTSLDIFGSKWALILEKEVVEMLKPIRNMLFILITCGIIAVIFSSAIMWFLLQGLKETTSFLVHSTTMVNSHAQQIAKGNNDLSERTEQQASLLVTTAASVEELTANVRTNTDKASSASSLADKAVVIADEGSASSQETKVAMEEISTSAKKISEIIKLVEDISFQTNLLAINAAIEAAKAGEMGKGFAVVAIEVRDLAARAFNAAKDIKMLIESSVEKVANGERLVNLNSEKLQAIVTTIKNVSTLMQEISINSREQFSAIEQVNNAITNLDSATAQNASLVKEIAHLGQEMTSSADQMYKLISKTFEGHTS